MDSIINKLFKIGVVSSVALSQYFDNLIKADEEIKNILNELGLMRNVNKFDRDFYKTWTDSWQIPNEIINFALEQSKSQYNPMQYMNKLLSLWHTKGLMTVDECKNNMPEQTNRFEPVSKKPKHQTREYSKSDLTALFDNLEEIDL